MLTILCLSVKISNHAFCVRTYGLFDNVHHQFNMVRIQIQ